MQTFREFVELINENEIHHVMDKFVPFAQKYLNIKDEDMPSIHTMTGEDSKNMKTFGCWDGENIHLRVDGRHPVDVMRTLGHEMVHHAKKHTDGSDGSDHENEANAVAGVILRKFAKAHPEFF
jgi:hypothetical protein